MSSELKNSFDNACWGLRAYARASALEDTKKVMDDVEAFDKILRRIVSEAEAR